MCSSDLLLVHSAPGNRPVVTTISSGWRVFVRGALRMDGAGKTWTPVMTVSGHAGWVAGWNVAYDGSARTRKAVVLRATPSLHGSRRGLVSSGARVRIVGSTRDRTLRAWLKVVTPGGKTGWIAGWLTSP